MKYLAQEGISVANIYNMHNIFKIREEFDIADVMLPNIHIDVRVVYDKDVIFVPKSHFANNLVPDVYVVFNMSQDSTHVDFLGFIKPENIDKSKQNSDYYFVDKEQLIHPFEFIEFVRNFEGNTTEVFSENLYSDAISLIDNDINSTKKQELIDALKKSSALREEMIEFDNFEWLSYNASKEDIIDSVTPEMPVVDEFDMFEEKDNFGFDDKQEDQELSIDDIPENIESVDTPIEDLTVTEDLTEDLNFDNIDDLSEAVTDNIEPLDIQETAETEEVSVDVDDLELSLPVDNLDEENVDLADVSEIQETDTEAQNEDIISTEEGGFTEELENFTEMVDLPENSLEEVNVSDNYSSDTVEDNTENTEELVDLYQPASGENIAEDVSNYEVESEEEALEELVSLEELNSEIDDSDKDKSAENQESLDELMELEAYNNSAAEETEHIEDVTEPEPEIETPQLESFGNSTVISSDNKMPGEIAIDINMPEQEDLGVLYDNSTAEMKTETVKTPEKGKKALVVAAAAAVVLAASATYFVLNHNKQQQIAETPPIEEHEPQVEEQPVPEENIVENETPAKTAEVKPAQPQSKPIESAYLDVKKMGWSVPDYVTYNDAFKGYLQTLGKSLRLALSSDLLLATEYPYSDQIFVDIDLANNGSVSNISVSKSSGSKQIDEIVLRTVKETTNVIKPPTGVIVGDKFHMTLKIYL